MSISLGKLNINSNSTYYLNYSGLSSGNSISSHEEDQSERTSVEHLSSGVDSLHKIKSYTRTFSSTVDMKKYIVKIESKKSSKCR